ncbi:LapA family protein [Actinomycetospora sp. TBRC 11914]|uniref:LapA family protein n=1 Tax=Actinomycetospora sp. TBRC 11914 TaxID=2729387 RepID=UPI00145E36D7|nr:LapA family protein [Actinomycetospora sp. TBRC 11914]NMO91755.1 LapA family protein [Actinomycetospora sp. TBRC 11914]
MTQRSPSRSTSTTSAGRTRLIIGVVLAVLAIVFIVENTAPTAIRLLIPVVTMPLWTALALMLVIGFVVGALVRRGR